MHRLRGLTMTLILCGAAVAARAQSVDPAIGRHVAETTCGECHDVGPDAPAKNPKSGAPSFLAVSRMPSTTGTSLKVFLSTSHAKMPNILLTSEEIDSVAAYILGLSKK
jgi:mono/diheme cytochrome c family protein